MDRSIQTSDYYYHLPEDRIAQHPLEQRDQSKLLVYRHGKILHEQFRSLPVQLPAASTLFFNDTRVIPARLIFQKETGALIEIFLLNPINTSLPLQLSLQATGQTQWKCMIGNLKRWKKRTMLTMHLSKGTLNANLIDEAEGTVSFSWDPASLSFAEVIEMAGQTPLPPYLHRELEPDDKNRYQTVYSRFEGAVAAPTAGLHFTDSVMEELKSNAIQTDFLTLHVSAGTFQPLKSENALEHTMHSEQVIVSRTNLDNLIQGQGKIIAVGTTSMRTLESLYWYGVKLLFEGQQDFVITQNDAYHYEGVKLPTRLEAFEVVRSIMSDQPLVGHTSIYIVPGYQFRVCDGLITNFHQPGSTLMLLVAAFIGDDWKRVYEEAISQGYRFLSYGDSSLLLP